MLDRLRKINAGQQKKYEALQERHENAHDHDGQGRKKEPGQYEQHAQNKFVAGYISEQTD